MWNLQFSHMWSTRKRGKGQKRQKEEGKIVSVRQSSFLLFSPVSPKCVLKLSSWSIISYFQLDSYINIQQVASLSGVSQIWSQFFVRKNTHSSFTYGDTHYY